MKTIETMIREAGGLEAVRQNYIRIENPPYMRLVIEVVAGPLEIGTFEVSVAHYGEQNGDAMRDPEMTFIVVPEACGWIWHPLTFRNDYAGWFREAARYDGLGAVETISNGQERGQAAFARQWDSNLHRQGFLDAFRRVHQRNESAPMSSDSNGTDPLLAGS
jgi:hypothetical protein